jgi:hypothetical protein
MLLYARPKLNLAPFRLLNHAPGRAFGDIRYALTPPIDTTGADLIVITGGGGLAGALIADDDLGNAWVAGPDIISPSVFIRLRGWFVFNPRTSPTHQFWVANAGDPIQTCSFQVSVWTGTGRVDQSSTNVALGPPLRSGALMPSRDNALIIAGYYIDATDVTIDGGFTISDAVRGTPYECYGSAQAYLLQDVAETVEPTWNWTSPDGMFPTPELIVSFIREDP